MGDCGMMRRRKTSYLSKLKKKENIVKWDCLQTNELVENDDYFQKDRRRRRMTSIRYGVCHIGFKGNVILALEGILLSTGLVQMGSCCTLVLFKMGDCLGKGISGLTVCPPPCTIMSHMPHSLRPITYLYLYYVFVFVRCQICHTVWGH